MKKIKQILTSNWLWGIICVVAVCYALFSHFCTFRISGSSMAPNLANNEKVIINPMNKHPKRGQVVIFNADGLDPNNSQVVAAESQKEEFDYVKRVIGLPGDTVEQKDGNLYVNGKKVNQSWFNYGTEKYQDLVNDDSNDTVTKSINGKYQKTEGSQAPMFKTLQAAQQNTVTTFLPNWDLKTLSQSKRWNDFSQNKVVVPKGCLFVMGDHRSDSNDSRYFGFVKESHLKGVVYATHHNTDAINNAYKHFFAK